jgi:hypothetical protein
MGAPLVFGGEDVRAGLDLDGAIAAGRADELLDRPARARMLGHASAAMTLAVYSGLFDDDLGALAQRMDAAHDAHETARAVGTVWARNPVAAIGDHDASR